jgi:glycosyltransferase involved in cell wall biosynthesis
MTIVFHVGYYKKPWNFLDITTNALGGSEKSVVLLTEDLSKNNKVYVVGSVIEGNSQTGVCYIPTQKIGEVPKQIDLLVGVNYIHFLKYYESFRVTSKWFWMHNTDFHPWYNGVELNPEEYNLSNPEINKIVCLTQWHKQKVMDDYKVDADKILVIGNPIDTDAFLPYDKNDKIPFSFIYTSHAERGLEKVLSEWPIIKKKYSQATLHNATPEYGFEFFVDHFFHKAIPIEGVTFYGALAQKELYNLMAKCQIWYYPTDYEETFCITAIEMMAHGVLPVTSLKASLSEVVGASNNYDNYNQALLTLN